MLANKVKDNTNTVGLVENSGIQFLDYEFSIDWDDRQDPRIKKHGEGRFVQDTGSEWHLVRLKINDDGKEYSNPFDPEIKFSDSDGCFLSLKVRNSVELYNGIWFPIPYYCGHDGPYNWARCRIVQIPSQEASLSTYHVCIAFDTTVQSSSATDYEHYGPTVRNVGNDIFTLGDEADQNSFLRQGKGGQSWVNEWAQTVFKDMAPLKIRAYRQRSELEKAVDERKEYEAHYLNMLSLIQYFVKPNPVNLISCSGEIKKFIDVDLILDIGNSRSFGLLYEEDSDDGDDDFNDTRILEIRDFNAPENVYQGAFESRVEFQAANFDYDGHSARSGRPDAFVWPSLVRVGNEAARLSANRIGCEGRTGLSSPKRYLWQDEPCSMANQWNFNSASYQIPYQDPQTGETCYFKKISQSESLSGRVFFRPVSDYITVSGDAVFAVNDKYTDKNMLSLFSGKSTMTFMLMEIFLQAMMQMNSYNARYSGTNASSPRRLKAIVLTTPPSMPELEREVMRSCAYEALGIIWKCRDYDKGSTNEFKFISGSSEMMFPVPLVEMTWDEAQADQILYLYNETQHIYEGNCKKFLEELRRPGTENRFDEIKEEEDEINSKIKHPVISGRIASIDIGGGTTDLVISDYSFPADETDLSADMRPREILREGFKVAGDDIMLDIIHQKITNPLKEYLRNGNGGNEAEKHFINLFRMSNDSQTRILIQQSVQQLFLRVGYRILSLLENVDKLPRGVVSCEVKGTLAEFINDQMQCRQELRQENRDPYEMPDEQILSYLNSGADGIGRYMPEGNILNFEICFDIFELNRQFTNGENISIKTPLDRLATIIEIYQCDVLLLTGRPSKIPGLRAHLLQRLSLPAKRQIALYDYRFEKYPLTGYGNKIGDPKSTVAVGALLAYKRKSSHRMVNFHFRPILQPVPSPVRFFGSIDNAKIMRDENVRYRFFTQGELDIRNGRKPNEENCYEMVMDRSNLDSVSLGRGMNVNNREFKAVLSHYMGYRQFDNEQFPATMTYVIESIRDVEDLVAVKKAAALSFVDENDDDCSHIIAGFTNPEAKQLLTEAEKVYRDKTAALESAEEIVNLKAAKETELRLSVEKQVEEEFKEQKAGILGVISGASRKLKEQKSQRFNELFEQRYQSDVLDVVSETERTLKRTVRREFIKSVTEAISKNLAYVRNNNQRSLNELKNLTDEERARFSIEIELKSDYPRKFSYLKQELGQSSLPQVASFELVVFEDVKDRKDFRNFVRMKLKTSAYESYWLDTGAIAD